MSEPFFVGAVTTRDNWSKRKALGHAIQLCKGSPGLEPNVWLGAGGSQMTSITSIAKQKCTQNQHMSFIGLH